MMRTTPFRTHLFAACVAAAAIPASAQDLYKADAGPNGVKQIDETWRDDARDAREVPVRIYLPVAKEPGEHKYPVIVFSHGLGASRNNYGYFGEHMASHGYIVVAPTHHGSDTTALRDWALGKRPTIEGMTDDEVKQKGWLMGSIADPANLANRPRDISFVIDRIGKDEAIKDIADMDRIGVAGHSFGAYTAMAMGGMVVDLPEKCGGSDVSFYDKRVKAVLPMSPEGPGTMGIDENSWGHFAVPVLFLTGTRDYGVGQRSAEWRGAGFLHVRGVDDYIVTLNDAGHMTFGGSAESATKKPAEGGGAESPARERIRERIKEQVQQDAGGLQEGSEDPKSAAHHTDMIESLSTAFFDAYLNHDAAAEKWLADYFAAKHDDCKAEFKPANTPKESQP